MAEYQKIEYRIGKNGKVTEKVINTTGNSCTQTTVGLEKALGIIETQELLPEYYEADENLSSFNNNQFFQQNS